MNHSLILPCRGIHVKRFNSESLQPAVVNRSSVTKQTTNALGAPMQCSLCLRCVVCPQSIDNAESAGTPDKRCPDLLISRIPLSTKSHSVSPLQAGTADPMARPRLVNLLYCCSIYKRSGRTLPMPAARCVRACVI